jgi:electron transfer flavoprotein alpha subunit
LGECAPTLAELSGKAREMADSLGAVTGEARRVIVVMLLDSAAERLARPEEAARSGADGAMIVRGDRLPSDRAACGRILAHLAGLHEPCIILAGATAYGRSVMPYAAALLGTGLTADCTGLSIEPGTGLLLQTRPAIGGNITATIKTPCRRPQMATVRPGTFKAPPSSEGRAFETAEPDVPAELFRSGARYVSFADFSESDRTLEDRDVVVSGGRGLRRADGFRLISELASLLDAGVGASRPAVEMKWIGYPHQVGLSGRVVSPKVYIAAGISGSVQHMAGMQTSECVVSINRDPDAQIFGISDVAICGDLYDVIPRLIGRIRKKLEVLE